LEWNQFFRDSWNLYGHVHNNRKHPTGFLGHDVGVDANGYAPVSFEQVKEIMFKIKERRLQS
jgi:calcineurin-like phosphoesterase family protein